jgi:hypothetical protein
MAVLTMDGLLGGQVLTELLGRPYPTDDTSRVRFGSHLPKNMVTNT